MKLFCEILKVQLGDCAMQNWSAEINSMSKLIWLNFDVQNTNYLLRNLEIHCEEVKECACSV